VGLWHGDVHAAARRRLPRDAPDLLLITPESIEGILIARDPSRRLLFEGVRTVVVDELHAFAGDDRGWYLLALLDRLEDLAGRRLQRLGLSATVGNPKALLCAAGLALLWRRGYVEHIRPPPKPYQVVTQQILALVLQHGGTPSKSAQPLASTGLACHFGEDPHFQDRNR
jgi:Lhr-like helicase